MKDQLLVSVKQFLKERIEGQGPLLLGYSGGPDSKALLYLLLECRRFFPIDLHLAHIDHGWRKESSLEAELLQKEAEALGLPFHLLRLEPQTGTNLEEKGRLARLAFFASLYQKFGCQALFLGHHAGDRAETVLKRIFEGAHLRAVSAFSREESIEGMRVLRPLTPFPKEQLLQWLKQKQLSYFQDATNESARFLRGRMRTELFPFLNRAFGKRVEANLCRLAEEARGVAEYFSERNAAILQKEKVSEEGFSLELKELFSLHPVQLKFLLKEWTARHQISLNQKILEGILDSIMNKNGRKRFETKKFSISIVNKNIIIKYFISF